MFDTRPILMQKMSPLYASLGKREGATSAVGVSAMLGRDLFGIVCGSSLCFDRFSTSEEFHHVPNWREAF